MESGSQRPGPPAVCRSFSIQNTGVLNLSLTGGGVGGWGKVRHPIGMKALTLEV